MAPAVNSARFTLVGESFVGLMVFLNKVSTRWLAQSNKSAAAMATSVAGALMTVLLQSEPEYF